MFFAVGCSKEDDLTPSYVDAEWFMIQDNPDDAVQHAAYGVYSSWGIPVFLNDTIGQQERGIDHNGQPIVYHKVLDLNYNLNNPANVYSIVAKRIALIQDEADKLAGIEFIDKVFLPLVPDIFHIQSTLQTFHANEHLKEACYLCQLLNTDVLSLKVDLVIPDCHY